MWQAASTYIPPREAWSTGLRSTVCTPRLALGQAFSAYSQVTLGKAYLTCLTLHSISCSLGIIMPTSLCREDEKGRIYITPALCLIHDRSPTQGSCNCGHPGACHLPPVSCAKVTVPCLCVIVGQ